MAGQRVNGESGKSSVVIRIITEVLGVEPVLDESYDLYNLRPDERVQSRIDRNNAPAHMVKRYASQMGEFEFPPIVVTQDGVKTDGNTRVKARAERGDRYCSALIIPIDYMTADDETKRKFLYVSEQINNLNGLPLDMEERRKMAETMIALGSSDAEICTKVGLPLRDVRAIREEYMARSRLQIVGKEAEIKTLSPGALRAFGKPKIAELDDEVVASLVDLSSEAGLKANEVKSLAISLGVAGSPELQAERLVRERESRADQIKARSAGLEAVSRARGLRSSLKVLFAYPATAFVEHNVEWADEHADILGRAQEVLREIEVLQAGIAPASQDAASAGVTH
jgi:hypothetical protein